LGLKVRAIKQFEGDFREHLKGKYHIMVDLLFDLFRIMFLCSTKFSLISAKYISEPINRRSTVM